MKRVLQVYFLEVVSKSRPILVIFSGSRTSQRPEHFFAGAAYRAFPIFRKILKTSSLGNFASAVSSVRVIDVSTIRRLTLIHFLRFCHYFLRSNHRSDVKSLFDFFDQIQYLCLNFIPDVPHKFYRFAGRIR